MCIRSSAANNTMALSGSFVRSLRPPLRSSTISKQPKRRAIETNAARTLQGCRLIGVGSSVPETVVTNFDLEKIVETSDEWITQRTGIRQRHVLRADEKLADHAVKASLKALEMGGGNPIDVDCVILATSSPDDIFGSACQVQNAIGATHAAAFDLTSACSGFVVALITAAQYIRTGCFQNVLVIGADALSRCVNWRDRSTCILFGDGCGAVWMTANDGVQDCALMGMTIQSDGGGYQYLNASFANFEGIKPLSDEKIASSPSRYNNIYMNGSEVYKWAVRGVPQSIDAALKNGGLTQDIIDWLVMHQANQRIIDSTAARLGMPSERVVSNLARYGNTSAASVPIALDEAIRGGKIQSGDVLALAGFGAGLTIAAAIVRWG